MTPWILLGVGLLLVALTALYVAAEFSLVTVDRATVDRAATDGHRRARAVQRALRRLSTQLSGAQIGITVTTLALGYVMEPSLAALLMAPLQAVGLAHALAATVAVTVSLLVATVLSMVFGELVPKNLALAAPLTTATRVVGLNTVTTAVCRPLIWAFNGTANAVLRAVGIEPQEELRSTRSAQELEAVVRRSWAHGTIEGKSAQLIAQSLSFSTKLADDVLTPRVDIVAVRADHPVSDVVATAVSSGISRFPVLGEDIDDIVGLVHLKSAVSVPVEDRHTVPVGAVMTSAPVLPGTLPLDDVLASLRGRGLQMAVVLDEYGGTAGVVTLEDVVEELVGEIVDEHDRIETRCVVQADGTYLVSGALRPDEIRDLTGITLPDPSEFDTLAGLIIEQLDHMPSVGDEARFAAALRPDVMFGALAGDTPVAIDDDAGHPRLVTVRAIVRRMAGRRVALVQLSAAGLGDSTDMFAPEVQ